MNSQQKDFVAPYMGATEVMPTGEVKIATAVWRGDRFSYDGSTHYEYWGDYCPEEMQAVIYGKKITLLPKPGR